MCGIAGVFEVDTVSPHLNRERVRSAIRKIHHRGPDEDGYFDNQNCSLGMCRLAIIDVEGGHQPSRDGSGRIISIFNGEIYNFKELRELLIGKGYALSSTGDSECIPLLYREFGDDFPKHLQGMFAIALWDEDKKRGILVRDRLGKKPLWFKFDGRKTSFSSEVKGLIELTGKLEFDLNQLPEYLQFGYVNAPRSVYRGVRQVNPGTQIVFDERGAHESTYWNYPTGVRSFSSYEEAKNETKLLLTDAIKLRLVSERPIGAFLSGGIDSSLVTAMMTRELGADTNTFSIGFENADYDESNYARAIAKHLKVRHRERIAHPDPALIINEISQTLDQPFADSSILPTYLLSRFAREEVVVALGGDGGDEVFGGYTRYKVATILDRVNFLLLISPAPLLKSLTKKNRRIEKLVRHLKYQEFSERYLGFQSLIQGYEIQDFIREELNRESDNLDLFEMRKLLNSESKLRSMQQFDLRTYLPGDLMYKADMATMASSLELRSPLLDYRVVELGLTLPDEYKVHGGVSKRILRDLLYEYVPRSLVDRPKMGFGIPQADWLRNELSGLVQELLLSSQSKVNSWINIHAVKDKVQQHNGGNNQDRFIWPILMLELWARNWL